MGVVGSWSKPPCTGAQAALRGGEPSMHTMLPWGLVLLCLQLTSASAPLSLFGSSYLFTEYKYPVDPGAGHRNRAEYARQYGLFGEELIREFGLGHHPGHGLETGRRHKATMRCIRGQDDAPQRGCLLDQLRDCS